MVRIYNQDSFAQKDLNKMANILQTTFSNAFLWKKMFVLWLKFRKILRLHLSIQFICIGLSSSWGLKMHQWTKSRLPYAITIPQWVKLCDSYLYIEPCIHKVFSICNIFWWIKAWNHQWTGQIDNCSQCTFLNIWRYKLIDIDWI